LDISPRAPEEYAEDISETAINYLVGAKN